MSKEFSIFTDVSNDAVEAVLCQIDENNVKYVVAYASKTFRGNKAHMGISEKEKAACVFGVKEFRHI